MPVIEPRTGEPASLPSAMALPYQAPAAKPLLVGIALAELHPRGCRYAVTPNDAPRNGHRFCGEPSVTGKSWCRRHFLEVFSVRGTGGESLAQAAWREGRR